MRIFLFLLCSSTLLAAPTIAAEDIPTHENWKEHSPQFCPPTSTGLTPVIFRPKLIRSYMLPLPLVPCRYWVLKREEVTHHNQTSARLKSHLCIAEPKIIHEFAKDHYVAYVNDAQELSDAQNNPISYENPVTIFNFLSDAYQNEKRNSWQITQTIEPNPIPDLSYYDGVCRYKVEYAGYRKTVREIVTTIKDNDSITRGALFTQNRCSELGSVIPEPIQVPYDVSSPRKIHGRVKVRPKHIHMWNEIGEYSLTPISKAAKEFNQAAEEGRCVWREANIPF